MDVASMAAARKASKTAPPTKHRDGFSLGSTNEPIVYDEDNKDLTHHYYPKFTDITYHVSTRDGCARIAFDRMHKLHAFRPQTIEQIKQALDLATKDVRVGVILLTSNVDEQVRTPAFSAGGDQHVRSNQGGYAYAYSTEENGQPTDDNEAVPRLHVLDLQVQMRRCPKPIIAVVQGYAIGGGHILHMMCDLTLASENAVFGQTGPRMGSFDAGYGSVQLAKHVGDKKAREIWFTCRFYDAQEALQMGLINAVFSKDKLDGGVAQWVRRINSNSPTALACIKATLNADQDGVAQMGGHLTRLFYMSAEGQEGRNAYLEGRAPQFRSLPTSRL